MHEAVDGQSMRRLGRTVAGSGADCRLTQIGPWAGGPAWLVGRKLPIGALQPAVRRYQVGEEPQRTGAVGQRVEHLEDDPLAMVHHSEQQTAPICLVDGSAGVLLLRRDEGAQVAVLQVVPEDTAAQYRMVEPIPLIGRVQGPLQQSGIHVVIHLGADPEHLGIGVASGGQEDVGGVVEPHPRPARHLDPSMAAFSLATGVSPRQALITSEASPGDQDRPGRPTTPSARHPVDLAAFLASPRARPQALS